ncbi:spore germination protein, partial [Heliobacterium chlorum]
DEGRSIELPQTEISIPGPHDAFVEDVQKNLYLLRTRLADPHFVVEKIHLKGRTKGPLYLAYIKGLTNPKIVREMRRRLKAVNVDMIYNLGQLEQFIQDNSLTVFSQILLTERPDRTISFLMEGSVAVLLEGTPQALIAPVTFFAYIHSPEDIYFRWPFGSFARLLRILSLLTTM